jgi:phosphoribosylformylglycinamidine synthase
MMPKTVESALPIYRIEIESLRATDDQAALRALADGGIDAKFARSSKLFLVEGELSKVAAIDFARRFLADGVTETVRVSTAGDSDVAMHGIEVHPLPGVTDPVAESALREARDFGFAIESVRTAVRYRFDEHTPLDRAGRALANDCVERVVRAPSCLTTPPRTTGRDAGLRRVQMTGLDNAALAKLSREGHLFLSLDEMLSIQSHFRSLGRDPTDLELETIAQTWSEHCVHKTLKSAIQYRGTGLPDSRTGTVAGDVSVQYDNLLADTIARATGELAEAGRGPACLSVFVDNAGVIGFDEEFGVAIKVETHNHPSAIEPYGGAATGIGGCIRDVMGCGLGARPIANTDVFCVAPSDWPTGSLPRGVLHPDRVLRGIVRGVADYGNRMGIPTVNGAVHFDPRYLGNPLVYCGCVGLIPRNRIEKAARRGDRIVVIGGRTGRDGIHGATFSSSELTGTHADEFSHAVQIGNPITQKRVLDALLRARDEPGGCLYSAVTDCGAGGLSSAIGEMGERVGATVDLETVPLKYAGLRYDEIWISEAQERMVLAVPVAHVERLLEIARAEEAEATVIGTFGAGGEDSPRLVVRFADVVVGDLDMRFLHHGWPRRRRQAEWHASSQANARRPAEDPAEVTGADLLAALGEPNAASKAWIIRQYDHEVQGGSVLKPLGGPGAGPNDAAVLRPRLNSRRGIVVGCGLASDAAYPDPYWMALGSLDEAIRNVVSVGGDPRGLAVLDNFCWAGCEDTERLGALVRACQACYDGAIAHGTPFISGKDSLNNEFLLRSEDIELVIDAIGQLGDGFGDHGPRIRRDARISIPDTLLITAISVIEDVGRCVSSCLKRPNAPLFVVGGLPTQGYALKSAHQIHVFVADAIRAGIVSACHDTGESGWLGALAEMAIGGDLGFTVQPREPLENRPLSPRIASYVLETHETDSLVRLAERRDVQIDKLGTVSAAPSVRMPGFTIDLGDLRSAWSRERNEDR